AEGQHKNQGRRERGPVHSEGAFHKQADDEGGRGRLLPGDDCENAGLHGEIEDGDAENRKINRTGDIALRIFHFAAKVADVVIAEIAVNRLDRGVAETGEENPGKIPGSGGVSEHELGIKMSGAAVDEPENGAENDDPEDG